MKKNTTAVVKASQNYVSVSLPGEQMDRATRVNYFHRVGQQGATIALEAAFRCGMELFKAKLEHVGTFEQWIEENCDFGRVTAYKYLSLLQKAISADDLPRLANGSEKARKSAIAEILSQSDSKTVTELFCEYGVMKKTPSNLGGKREGAGRKRKDAKELAEAAEQAAKTPELLKAELEGMMTDLYRFAELERSFEYLDRTTVEETVRTLDKITKRARLALTNM